MIINHNLPALNTYRQMVGNNAANAKAMEKLSSGMRINRAGDDAAGLAISEKMRAQIRGLNQANRNSQDAISMIQTTEGALNETHSILQRMRELANQAANDTNVSVDRNEIQKEINQLTSEINRIGNTTEFNTRTLLNGSLKNNMVLASGSFTSGSVTTNLTVTTANATELVKALGSGSHTITVAKTNNTAEVGSVEAKHSIFTSGVNQATLNAALTFSGNEIIQTSVTSGMSGVFIVSGDSLQFQVYSGGFLRFDDTITVGEEYNNHGFQFKITDYDTTSVADGDAMAWITSGTDGSYGAKDVAFTSAAATLNSGLHVMGNVEGDLWTIYNDGSNNIFITNSGSTGVSASGTVRDLLVSGASGGAISYGQHGISISGALGDLSGTNRIVFALKSGTTGIFAGSGMPAYYTATLGSVTTNVAFGQTSLSGLASGLGLATADLDVDVDVSASGVEILTEGSFNFTLGSRMSGEDGTLKFQIGANQNQALSLEIEDMRSKAIGVATSGGDTQYVNISRLHTDLYAAGTMKSGGDLGGAYEVGKFYIQATFTSTSDVTDGTNNTGVEKALSMADHDSAKAAVTVINDAIERVSAERSKLGANQNRLEHTINNLGTAAENLQAAESRIRDVDMAKEMMEFTKNNILAQAAQAMLAQANQQPQSVLSLLR